MLNLFRYMQSVVEDQDQSTFGSIEWRFCIDYSLNRPDQYWPKFGLSVFGRYFVEMRLLSELSGQIVFSCFENSKLILERNFN